MLQSLELNGERIILRITLFLATCCGELKLSIFCEIASHAPFSSLGASAHRNDNVILRKALNMYHVKISTLVPTCSFRGASDA